MVHCHVSQKDVCFKYFNVNCKYTNYESAFSKYTETSVLQKGLTVQQAAARLKNISSPGKPQPREIKNIPIVSRVLKKYFDIYEEFGSKEQ